MESLNTYNYSFKIFTKDCDVNGKWKLSSMLEYFQETGNMHCKLLGAGDDVMLTNNVTWVLARYGIEVYRYPKIGESLTVETIPLANCRFIFPRLYRVYDEKGSKVAEALGAYSVLDIIKRRLVMNPVELIEKVPDNSDLGIRVELPPGLPELSGDVQVSTYHTMYTDLDFNGHMNNVKYADLLCNTLGTDVMREYEIASLVINYKKEVRPESDIEIHMALEGDGVALDGAEVALDGVVDGETAFKIAGKLRRR